MKVRFFAAAAEAAGVEELRVGAPTTLAELRADLAERFGDDFDRVWERCSFLIDSVAATDPDADIAADATVDVLPPFAGG